MNSPATKSNPAGFSLVELVIVLAIIGILTSLGVPAWQDQLMQQRRSAAASLLLTIEARQARFLLQNRRYALANELSLPPPAGLGIDQDSARAYRFEIAPDATGFLARAIARSDGPQVRDRRCHLLTLDATGARGAFSQSGAETARHCWQQ